MVLHRYETFVLFHGIVVLLRNMLHLLDHRFPGCPIDHWVLDYWQFLLLLPYLLNSSRGHLAEGLHLLMNAALDNQLSVYVCPQLVLEDFNGSEFLVLLVQQVQQVLTRVRQFLQELSNLDQFYYPLLMHGFDLVHPPLGRLLALFKCADRFLPLLSVGRIPIRVFIDQFLQLIIVQFKSTDVLCLLLAFVVQLGYLSLCYQAAESRTHAVSVLMQSFVDLVDLAFWIVQIYYIMGGLVILVVQLLQFLGYFSDLRQILDRFAVLLFGHVLLESLLKCLEVQRVVVTQKLAADTLALTRYVLFDALQGQLNLIVVGLLQSTQRISQLPNSLLV